MKIIIVVYSILLSLLIGGYITLLFEIRELKRFKDVFISFMKSQRDLNNAQVEHDIKVIDFINEIGQAIRKEESDVRKSAQLERKKGKWIEEEKGIHVTSYRCSECGRTVMDDTGYDVSADYPFCNCGADMRGGRDE